MLYDIVTYDLIWYDMLIWYDNVIWYNTKYDIASNKM